MVHHYGNYKKKFQLNIKHLLHNHWAYCDINKQKIDFFKFRGNIMAQAIFKNTKPSKNKRYKIKVRMVKPSTKRGKEVKKATLSIFSKPETFKNL
jgi:hypothetical protein